MPSEARFSDASVGRRIGARVASRTAVTLVAVGLLVVVGGSVVLAIGLGPAQVSPSDTARLLWAGLTGGRIGAADLTTYQVIWQVRTPRVLLAAVVGAGLSVVGVAVQAMVRNALATRSCSACPRAPRSAP